VAPSWQQPSTRSVTIGQSGCEGGTPEAEAETQHLKSAPNCNMFNKINAIIYEINC